jgi:hypothetical protein
MPQTSPQLLNKQQEATTMHTQHTLLATAAAHSCIGTGVPSEEASAVQLSMEYAQVIRAFVFVCEILGFQHSTNSPKTLAHQPHHNSCNFSSHAAHTYSTHKSIKHNTKHNNMTHI